MPARYLIAAGLLALGAATLPAQTPTLVADLNQTPPYTQAMAPHGLVKFKGAAFFNASTHATGGELYRSTGGKPTLVVDIAPGSASSDPNKLTVVGNQLAFLARHAELWFSDGTATGTRRVFKLPVPFLYAVLVAAGNRLFLAVHTRTGGDLWVSDGTTAGTVRLATGVVERHQMMAVGNQLFFAGRNATTGVELWRSDGTARGTALVRDILAGTGHSYPRAMGVLNGRLVFTATDANTTAHWISDGTTVGTKILIDTNPRSKVEVTTARATLGGRLYFASLDASNTTIGLWSTGGTAATTKRIATIPSAIQMATHNGQLWFTSGGELWSSDGTTAGTKRLTTIQGAQYLYLGQSSGTHLFFSAFVRSSRSSWIWPWATDGTVTGTQQLGPFRTSSPVQFVSLTAGTALFSGLHAASKGHELIISNGTATGTRVAYDYKATGVTQSSGANPRVDLGHYVTGPMTPFPKGSTYTGIFVSDGTPGGSRTIPDTRHGQPLDMSLDGAIYATDRHSKLERIDPATLQRRTIFHGAVHGGFRLGDAMYFVGNGANGVDGIYRTDGTASGTKLLQRLGSAAQNVWVQVKHGDAVYALVQRHGSHGRLWRIDGTKAGTYEFPGTRGSPWELVYDVHTTGQHLLITTTTGTYVSDGTPAGSKRLTSTTWLGRPRTVGNTTYFQSRSTVNTALWKTDGTPTGTAPVKQIQARASWPPFGSAIGYHRGLLYFYARTGAHGMELWKSDGTANGTTLLKDIHPGPQGSNHLTVHSMAAGEQYFYFAATDPTHGAELWRTDGTTAGTKLVHDLNPGLASSSPTHLLLRRGALWFTATDGMLGSELWRLDVGAITHRVGYGCAAKGTPPQLAATTPRLGSRMTFDVANIASSARATVLAFGIGVRRQTYLGAGCSLHVDFGLPTIVQYLTPRNGKAQLSLTVPTVPSLHGALVPAQAAVGPTGNVPLGVDLSHGLFLAFRR